MKLLWHWYVEFSLEAEVEKEDGSEVHHRWTFRFRPVPLILVLILGALVVLTANPPAAA